ncbi:putative ribonuclease H-like domain-containing protein [Tanacetum coccineum]
MRGEEKTNSDTKSVVKTMKQLPSPRHYEHCVRYPPSEHQLSLLLDLYDKVITHIDVFSPRMRNKCDLDTLSTYDLYNYLKVYEAETKGQSSSSTNSQNVAFVSSDNTSSTNETVNTANDVSAASSQGQVSSSTYVDDVMFSFFANQSNSPKLDNKDQEQIDTNDLEEMDLKWTKIECYNCHRRGHFTRECRAPRNQGNRNRDNARRVVLVETPANALVVQDGIGCYDWSFQDEEGPTNFVLKPYNILSKDSLKKPKTVRPSAPIIEDWESDSDDDCVIRPTADKAKPKFTKINFVKSGENVKFVIKENTYRQAEYPRKVQSSRSNRRNLNEMMTQKLGNGFKFIKKACFVCGSLNHLIKDCNFYENKMEGKSMLNNEGKVTGQREIRPVWNNAQRVNHQNKFIHPHPKRNFVPAAVLTKSGQVPVNTTKQSFPRAAVSISTARYVNTAATRPTVNGAKPSSNVFHKSHSPVRRTFTQKAAPKNSDLKGKVNTARVNNVTTAGSKVVVSAAKGNRNNAGNPQYALQDQGIFYSGCSRHMTGNKSFLTDYQELDGGFVAFAGSPKGGKITGKGKIRTGKLDFEDVYFVKELKFNLFSVSQMCDKKNNVLFTKTECLILSPDFKLLDESKILLKVPKHNNMYSFDLKNIVPSGGLTCLFAKATIDESNLWHRRLGHVNFKTMNKLVRGNLVRGLPSKLFKNDHTCVACQKGKQHKASCKTKTVSSICKPLQLLHMDLFGPVSVRSINKKTYCLVVTDDFSRFSWVFFLANKDETPEILKSFITGIENQIDLKVKAIRCDNGTEFKNRIMNELCEMKGIRREFSVARTPQQNGVAERKNRTLIEAARTMLADSKLPTTFWVEAVNTDCYVQNRVTSWKEDSSLSTIYTATILNSDSQSPKSLEDEVDDDDARKKNEVLDPAKEDDMNGQREATNTNNTNRLNTVSSLVNVVSSSFTIVDPGRKRDQRNEFDRMFGQDKDANENSTYRIFTPVSTDRPSYVNLDGSIPVNAANLPNDDLPTDPLMPNLEDPVDLQDTGIFSGAYDNEDMASTPIETNKALIKDEEAEDVDVHLYRSMIGSLMYLTASRPDIMFVVCACVRFQATPKVSHLYALKGIFRYLKGQPKLGLWYPRDSPFDLEDFSDSDYVGASLDRKSTTGCCQFLDKRLISWQCKKQTIVASSTTKAEYVAAANCCGQVLWIQN